MLSEMMRAWRYGEVLSLLMSFRMLWRAGPSMPQAPFCGGARLRKREFFIDNLLVRWTGLAPWEFEFPFPGSLTSTFLGAVD